ncbi:MAG: branched-chain amino acid ABC transporter permease [Thermoplasmata archaeon]
MGFNPFLVAVLGGLGVGSLYVVFALGMNLLIGVMRVINFSHGYLMLLGSYLTYFLWEWYGLNPLLSLLIVMPALFAVGVLFHFIMVQPVLKRPQFEDTTLLLTFAGLLVLDNIFVRLWTDNQRQVPTSYFNTPVVLVTPWGDAVLSQVVLIGAGLAAAATIALGLFLRYTWTGRAMRAASQDLLAARLLGIPATRLYAVSFGISALLAGIAGVVVAMEFLFYPEFGFDYLLKAFGVIMMGGLGSLVGTIAGGLSLGVAESMTAWVFNGQYGIWANGVAYVAILVALALRAFLGKTR